MLTLLTGKLNVHIPSSLLLSSTSVSKLRNLCGDLKTGKSPSESTIAVPSSKAKEFLLKLSRSKRNIWDRSRPDVQQWIMQFMQLGYDEQRLEADLSYWMDQARASDHGRQHHYDENSPYGP
uniref:ECRG4 augurin precursor a n=1 Tax=Oryzias latipes TaxID=8090 RepID=A0A3P9JD62_ORYLA